MTATFVFDLDGVVVDFVQAFNEWHATTYGGRMIPAQTWTWFEDYPDGAKHWDEFWSGPVQEAFRWAPPVDGALAGLDEARSLGRVVFATYRPEKVMGVTRTWLDHQGQSGVPVFHVRDKSLVHGDLYVDDHIENVVALRLENRRAFLFDAPYNADALQPRLRGWEQVVGAATAIGSEMKA